MISIIDYDFMIEKLLRSDYIKLKFIRINMFVDDKIII